MRFSRPEFEHLKTAAEVRHWAAVNDAQHGDPGLSALARQHALDLEAGAIEAPTDPPAGEESISASGPILPVGAVPEGEAPNLTISGAMPRFDELPIETQKAMLADDSQPPIDPITHHRRSKGA